MKNVPMLERISLFLLIVFLLLLPCLSSAEEPTPTTADPAYGAAEFKAGEIIVKFKEGMPKASVQSLLLAEDLEILDEMDQLGILLLSVAEGQELEKIEELKRHPLVEYAEPNYVVQIAHTTIEAEPHYSPPITAVWPNDPYFFNGAQWNLAKIEAPAAWDTTTGSQKVVIAIVDTGVDLDHPELKDKLWTNPGEIPGNGKDDDGNGFVDDVHGWDFVNWDSKPDDFWHGTYLASVAAAETNNGILIAGVSWGAEIMPVKVFGPVGRVDVYRINGGITYAVDNGADIIDLGFTFSGSEQLQPLQAAINHAYSKGALIVAGSGVLNPDYPVLPPGGYFYPGALDHVVSVAATDRYDRHPDFSAYNDKVDVAAPGVGIYGVCIHPSCGEPTAPLLDVHAAAAHVSGLAALIWSVNPNLTPDQVEDIIKSTAVDLGEPGRDDYFGHGRIDAAAAVMATTHYFEIEANRLDFGCVCDQCITPSRSIANPNTNSSTWRAVPTDDWLSISGPQGLTPSSAVVSIDKGALADYGVYTAGITAISIMTNAEHSPIIIPVTGVYATQCWKSYLPLLFKDHSPD